MVPASEKGWKYYLGLVLLGYGLSTFGLVALTPLLFTPALAATVATGLVISGEVGFWVGAALLGRPFIETLKTKLQGLFIGLSAVPRPVSRRRHAFGLVLFSLSFLTYYLAMAIPFLGWEKSAELTAIIAVALTGELFFLTSLFVLGGEFWERLRGLYRWPATVPESPKLPAPESVSTILSPSQSLSTPLTEEN